MKRLVFTPILLAACLLAGACHHATPAAQANIAANAAPPSVQPAGPDYLAMVLLPPAGNGKTDQQIIQTQREIKRQRDPAPWVERLGWLYIAKARESFDPGFYKLAEACAFCLESTDGHSLSALLLRGHVLQNLHRFKEAEPLARELLARRGLSFDYGLLGDVLMEQWRLDEAAGAYQKMVDQKPDLQAYARIAYLRWLKGDVSGASQVMELAVTAASPNAPEAAAWVNTRMALLKLQNGELDAANESCEEALEYHTNYAPALLVQGRLLLANGRNEEAVETLRRAEGLNPLPDYEWVLSEALQAAGDPENAAKIADEMARQGAASDPRTYSLYLATSGRSPALALELAQNELNTRADVFTHDAVAWALAANGRTTEAWQEMQAALAEGTKDARLSMHAAVLAAKAGQADAAREWLTQAISLMPMLLPSEQKQLMQAAELLGEASEADPVLTAMTDSGSNPEN